MPAAAPAAKPSPPQPAQAMAAEPPAATAPPATAAPGAAMEPTPKPWPLPTQLEATATSGLQTKEPPAKPNRWTPGPALLPPPATATTATWRRAPTRVARTRWRPWRALPARLTAPRRFGWAAAACVAGVAHGGQRSAPKTVVQDAGLPLGFALRLDLVLDVARRAAETHVTAGTLRAARCWTDASACHPTDPPLRRAAWVVVRWTGAAWSGGSGPCPGP